MYVILRGITIKGINNPVLAKRVRYFKENPEGVRTMLCVKRWN